MYGNGCTIIFLVITGSIIEEDLKRTVTGVAISDTTDTLSIYFGCYANSAATGGVGLMRISKHGLDYQLYPVQSGGTSVYGGSLFLAESTDTCLHGLPPLSGTIPPPILNTSGHPHTSAAANGSVQSASPATLWRLAALIVAVFSV